MTRRVKDVMTRQVVVVNGTAGFKEIVRLMKDHRVSALPVVARKGVLEGIVSEADLLLKEQQAAGSGEWHPLERRRRRVERTKAEGLVAGQLMTSPVVTVSPDATLAQAARLMHRRRVKRMPVVDREGRVVGIVSRGDLLRVFLRPDQDIRRDVAAELIEAFPWVDPERVRVEVRDGVVRLQGTVDQRSMIRVLTGLVLGIDGVVGVDDRLTFEVDDSAVPPGMYPWGAGAALRP